MQQVSLAEKYHYFVTSPPYPNYRDYSKLFKIENYVLDSIIVGESTDFNMMIGSNNGWKNLWEHTFRKSE